MRAGSVVAGVTAWTLGAVAAIAVGIAALSIVGAGLTDTAGTGSGGAADQPGTSATTPDGTRSPADGAQPTRTGRATGSERSIDSAGGTVGVRCDDTGAYLTSWIPKPGFRTDEFVRGPAATVYVKFEENGREVRITITCVAGIPQPSIHDEQG